MFLCVLYYAARLAELGYCAPFASLFSSDGLFGKLCCASELCKVRMMFSLRLQPRPCCNAASSPLSTQSRGVAHSVGCYCLCVKLFCVGGRSLEV